MKLTKKILLAAVAVAAVMFAGCKNWSLTSAMQKSFGADMFKYNDVTYDAGLGTWKIEGEVNESEEEYERGVKLLLTKHSDIAGLVQIGTKENSSLDKGVLGIAFDVTQNKSDKDAINYKTWNFGVIGLRNYNGVPQYYVSYFANVSDAQMSALNFGAATPVYDAEGNITGYKKPFIQLEEVSKEKLTAHEVVIKNFTNLPKTLINDGVLTVAVDIDEDADTGDYLVKIYDQSAVDKNNSGIKADAKILNGPGDKILASKIGKEGAAQAYVGVYANIYGGQTMDGSLEILDLTHQALPVEE